MKKSITVIAALCIGIILGSVSNVFAAVGDMVEAQFAKFTILVDGQEQKLEADPLVVQGSAYVPVRAFANMMGKDVVFKGDSRTIELNTPKEVAKEGASSVVDFRTYPPEIINGQVIGMEAMLKSETDPENITRLQEGIDDRKAYLEQIGWDDGTLAKLEDQLRIVNGRIDTTLYLMEIEKDNQEIQAKLQADLEDFQSQKSELEAQIEAQQTPAE